MCEYIHSGACDEAVRWWAECGILRYGLGNREPRAACWAMFWLVKHAIQFARDEPRLFQVGEPDALDMLIAPALLVRMDLPKEDCDGFTMLICALLLSLGIQSVIVTVAADPSDPSRWSHVFPMAVLPSGNMCTLDASRGSRPGWMVPREHIFRWQAWSLAGEPINVPIPARNQGLHGYVRRGLRMGMGRRGMGQCYDELGNPTSDCGQPAPEVPPVSLPTSPGFAPGCYDSYGNAVLCGSPTAVVSGTAVPVSITAPAGSSPTSPANWGSIINTAITSAGNDLRLATLPAGSYVSTNPVTGVQTIVTGTPGATGASLLSAASLGSLGSLLPFLGIGLVAVLVLSMLEKK